MYHLTHITINTNGPDTVAPLPTLYTNRRAIDIEANNIMPGGEWTSEPSGDTCGRWMIDGSDGQYIQVHMPQSIDLFVPYVTS